MSLVHQQIEVASKSFLDGMSSEEGELRDNTDENSWPSSCSFGVSSNQRIHNFTPVPVTPVLRPVTYFVERSYSKQCGHLTEPHQDRLQASFAVEERSFDS